MKRDAVTTERVAARHPACLAALMLVVLLPTLVYSQASPPDSRVKAALLYHFTQFIDWPLPQDGSPFLICVADDPATTAALVQLTRGKSLNSHPLRIRKMNAGGEAGQCRMLFVAAPARLRVQHYLRLVCSSSVLTVGEGSAFRELGGMIELFPDEQHIAFRMNVPAIQHARLSASSQLLRLAQQGQLHSPAEGYH